MENRYSDLTVDIEKSIARAYDLNLQNKDLKEVKAHLAYTLPRLTQPNSLIKPIKDALTFIHAQEGISSSWKDWLGKPILVAFVTTLVTAPISFYVGLSIEKSKASDCQTATVVGQGITNHSSVK